VEEAIPRNSRMATTQIPCSWQSREQILKSWQKESHPHYQRQTGK
jgi:hypothetical protein